MRAITGVGIPPGTTISSGGGTTTLTHSQAATVAAGAALSYGGTTSIVVDPGATLTLDNTTATTGGANRLGNHPLTLSGGHVELHRQQRWNHGRNRGRCAGTLILNPGQNVINITNNGGNTILNFGAMTSNLAANAGSTLDIESNTTLGTTSNQVKVGVISTSAALAHDHHADADPGQHRGTLQW